MNVTIVLPTLNEAENIEKFLSKVYEEISKINGFNINTLVVDGNSTDKTVDIIKVLQKSNEHIYLIKCDIRGLGNAYKLGFKYAIENLKADTVIEMDSDFSHNPNKIKELLEQIENGYDFVIGSRYVKGGSIPKHWSIFRKLNSRFGNIFARCFAGLDKIKDCTSGFRAINANVIKQIKLEDLKVEGYSFQMNILYECINVGARVCEIPIDFVDRENGKSKLRIVDITEFIANSFQLFFKRFI